MGGLIFAAGTVIVVITAANVVFTLVLPRRPSGIERLSLVVNRTVRIVFLAVSRAARSYEVKDAMLAPAAPVALLTQLAVWLGFFVVGYACMLEPTTHGFSGAFTQAAVSMFSVGTSQSGGHANRAVDIAAGATWAVVVTLQIAYLPSLYDAFNRREALVAMLESRAGLPAWGPEVLARHQSGRHRRRPSRAVLGLGALGRGRGRESHHLSRPSVVPLSRAVVLVGGGVAGGARRRRHVPGVVARRVGVTGPFVSAHGLHHLQPDRQDPRMARGPRPQSRGADLPDLRGVPTSRAHAAGDRLPDGAHRRRGMAELSGLAGELRDDRIPVGGPYRLPSGAVVGTTEPYAFGHGGAASAAATEPRRQGGGRPPSRRRGLAPRRRGTLTRPKNPG